MENTVKKDKTTKILIALISVMIVGIGVLIWMVVDLNAKKQKSYHTNYYNQCR